MAKHKYLFLLLLAFIIVGVLFAVYTPDWQAPDEPAHYNYVRQLASGHFPVMESGDYDQAYQSIVISSQFDEKYSVESFEYQDYQPPLYYLLQTPVYLLFGESLLPLRLVSLLFGIGVITATYFIVLSLFPGRKWLALLAAAFVAFLPQHLAMMAAVNNDSLAELIIAAILLVAISLLVSGRDAGWDQQKTRLVILGILLGLGYLTKVSVYIMTPLVGVMILWLYWRKWPIFWRSVLFVFGPALLLGAIWWVRNAIVYGGWDLLGTAAHNRFVVGQPLTSEWIAEKGLVDTFKAFVQTTFQSFWGQFGWMGVVMPSWVYQALLVFSLATIGGLLWAGVSYRTSSQEIEEVDTQSPPHWQAPTLILLGTFLLSLLVYLTYNLTFVQHQGRYLFSGLVPIAIGFAIAWAALMKPLLRRWPTLAVLLPLGLAVGLIALDLLALFRYIVPSLT